MTNRTEQLHQLMATHGLTAEKVGELLNRSPQTVRIWRCKDDKRQIPEHALGLLRIILERQGVARQCAQAIYAARKRAAGAMDAQ